MINLKEIIPAQAKDKVVSITRSVARELKNRISQTKIDLNCNILGVPIRVYVSTNSNDVMIRDKCNNMGCQQKAHSVSQPQNCNHHMCSEDTVVKNMGNEQPNNNIDTKNKSKLSKEATFSELSNIESDLEESISFLHETTTGLGLSSTESQVLNKADIVESEDPEGITVLTT